MKIFSVLRYTLHDNKRSTRPVVLRILVEAGGGHAGQICTLTMKIEDAPLEAHV